MSCHGEFIRILSVNPGPGNGIVPPLYYHPAQDGGMRGQCSAFWGNIGRIRIYFLWIWVGRKTEGGRGAREGQERGIYSHI